MNKLHSIQNQILKKLMFATSLRYTEMKPDKDMENNQFQFHLDQLIKNEFIVKENSTYKLANKGKQYIKKMDDVPGQIIKQAHLSVRIVCTREIQNEKEYLFYTRLKHPYYGCQGFPAGKLEHGEKLEEAAKRELLEETGLNGHAKLAAITHYLDLDKNGECLIDKIMFLFIVKNPEGKLEGSHEGKYEWVNESDIKKAITKPFENIEVLMEEIDLVNSFNGNITLLEKENEVESNF